MTTLLHFRRAGTVREIDVETEPADGDALTEYEELQRRWMWRARTGRCPHCGDGPMGMGLTCGAEECLSWGAMLPDGERWLLQETRAQHRGGTAVLRWSAHLLVGVASGFTVMVMFALGTALGPLRWPG